jgi:hypothetical protein
MIITMIDEKIRVNVFESTGTIQKYSIKITGVHGESFFDLHSPMNHAYPSSSLEFRNGTQLNEQPGARSGV